MLEIEGDVDLSQLKGTMGEPFEFTLNLKNTSEKVSFCLHAEPAHRTFQAVSDLSLTFTDGSSLFDKAYPIPAIAPSASFPIVLKVWHVTAISALFSRPLLYMYLCLSQSSLTLLTLPLQAELPKFFVGELKPVYTLLNKKKKPVNIKKSDGTNLRALVVPLVYAIFYSFPIFSLFSLSLFSLRSFH